MILSSKVQRTSTVPSRSPALELNCIGTKVNVRVNAIAPGFFLTAQNKYLLLDEKTNEYTTRAKKIIDHTPMGRFGELDEIPGAVIYLVSNMSKFVTGTVLPVDGGFGIYSGV